MKTSLYLRRMIELAVLDIRISNLHSFVRSTWSNIGDPISFITERMESPKKSGKVCLLMLEGIGVSEDETRNAVRLGKMEFLESLRTEEKTLYYELEANGEKVGSGFYCERQRLEFQMEFPETMESVCLLLELENVSIVTFYVFPK